MIEYSIKGKVTGIRRVAVATIVTESVGEPCKKGCKRDEDADLVQGMPVGPLAQMRWVQHMKQKIKQGNKWLR